MNELDRLRDHAGGMATAEHRPTCRAWVNRPSRWGWQDGRWQTPDPDCGGCVTPAERALWRQIAGEIDDYIDGAADDGQEALL